MFNDYEVAARERCLFLNEQFAALGLYIHEKREKASGQGTSWLIAPEPFVIDEPLYRQIQALGPQLLKFYKACNQLYFKSIKGIEPPWVSDYLDKGKSDIVIEYGRMRRFKSDLSFIIRPDIILTDNGFVITELDSVPGGIGFLGAMNKYYSALGFDVVGGQDGMIKGFLGGIKGLCCVEGDGDDGVRKDREDDEDSVSALAVVVSEESASYRKEMEWLTNELVHNGINAATISPEELEFTENGLFVEGNGNGTRKGNGDGIGNKKGKEKKAKVSVLYRFFELFDLKNIPKIDLILYAIRKELVKVTPSLKSYLEEKMLFAFLHHPALEQYWQAELGSDVYSELLGIIPKTWIMDPAPLPPIAVIPELKIGGRHVNSWEMLKSCTKKERELVLKVSGFSELAWGSHGVSIGHDLSSQDWADAIQNGLDSFETNPYVLQEFHKGVQVGIGYYDFKADTVRQMSGRVRLCPYYFVHKDEVILGGILATICPLDKKLIHGMTDAVMVPTMVRRG